jgi:chromosome segregation ATPase
MENLNKAVIEIQELLEHQTIEIQSLLDTIEKHETTIKELHQQLQDIKAIKNMVTVSTETESSQAFSGIKKKLSWIF